MVGDLVLAPLPFSDLRGTRIRPVIVLADVREVGENDWIVCQVTSRNYHRRGDIAIIQSDLQQGRLALDSWARPMRLYTLDEQVFVRTIGQLTDAKLAEVLAAVRALF